MIIKTLSTTACRYSRRDYLTAVGLTVHLIKYPAGSQRRNHYNISGQIYPQQDIMLTIDGLRHRKEKWEIDL